MIIDTNAHIVLEDDMVLLRPLVASDFEHLLPYALNEPDTWEYSLTSAAGTDGMKTYIQAALNGKANGDSLPFVVFDKRSWEWAGSTRFYDIQRFHKTLQLGYTWYGKKFRGSGLNKHCKFLMLQYAFETAGALRVEFRADARNAKSVAAMKSIGATPEGILRSNCVAQDGRRDSIVLSILQQEWFDKVKASLNARCQ